MPKSVRRETPEISGPTGVIEALVEMPSDDLATGDVAVVCHPHPAHGGAMTNKVVHTLARAFNLSGIGAVRFNFRGVGASEGNYDEGRGELDDALAVIEWARARWPTASLSLAGFSFGADIALRASQQFLPERLILIAPPVGRIMAAESRIPDGLRTLIVQGEQDELVDADNVLDWVNLQPVGVRMALMPGADHFFHGQLPALRDILVTEIESSAIAAVETNGGHTH
ncbi:MAG: alpha/beta fold hydrolase [Pseudomonadota bacterium]